MRHPGREMSDPSDLRASQWLTQICGLGQPVAVASRGPPRQISQQIRLRAAPSEAAARRVDSLPRDGIARESSGKDGLACSCAMGRCRFAL